MIKTLVAKFAGVVTEFAGAEPDQHHPWRALEVEWWPDASPRPLRVIHKWEYVPVEKVL